MQALLVALLALCMAASTSQNEDVPLCGPGPVMLPCKNTRQHSQLQQPNVHVNVEKAALLTAVESGGGWPLSWNETTEPCGAGWDNLNSGWYGVECNADGGNITKM